jgi:hypothetical protein
MVYIYNYIYNIYQLVTSYDSKGVHLATDSRNMASYLCRGM